MSDEDFLFNGLDDPTPPAPSADMLERAVSRGRVIRRRRQSLSVLAAASVLAVVGGVAAVVNAQGGPSSQRDNIVPAQTPTVSASVAPGRHHPHIAGAPSYAVGAYPPITHRDHQPAGGGRCAVATPPPAPPATDSPAPTPTDTPAVADSPATDVTEAPTPSATSAPDTCASPIATPGVTGSPSPQPTDIPTDSPTPA